MLNTISVAAIKLKVFIDTVVFDFKHKEKGAVDIVAIIILIAIAVAVAIIFKGRLTDLVNKLFDALNKKVTEAVGG